MTVQPQEKLLLTVEETAALLNIGRTKAWELIRNGILPSLRLGRCVRIPLQALEQWIAREMEAQTC
ncbi:MAG TPA: helix-turn-helix domain-containing protein [Thermomicrobiales bacterium]